MKVFYFVRVDKKLLKQIPNLPANIKEIIPNYYVENSNFISEVEGIFMRWLEINYEIIFGT